MAGKMSHWRRSSHSCSDGHCVEVCWRKSSHSSFNGDCVETRAGEGAVQVRDSKDPEGPVLKFSEQSWGTFMRRIKQP